MTDPSNTRVWLFQADRLLADDEVSAIEARLSDFMDAWLNHGSKLSAKADVRYNIVVAISIDLEIMAASGCSIDKMTHFIQDLGQGYKVDFFNRQNVAVLSNGGISIHHMHDIQDKLTAGLLHEDDLMLDNLIDNGADLATNWLKPISKSWLNRFITI